MFYYDIFGCPRMLLHFNFKILTRLPFQARILPHIQSFLSGFPEIFIINATSILLIQGVVFSTSKKYNCLLSQ